MTFSISKFITYNRNNNYCFQQIKTIVTNEASSIILKLNTKIPTTVVPFHDQNAFITCVSSSFHSIKIDKQAFLKLDYRH